MIILQSPGVKRGSGTIPCSNVCRTCDEWLYKENKTLQTLPPAGNQQYHLIQNLDGSNSESESESIQYYKLILSHI